VPASGATELDATPWLSFAAVIRRIDVSERRARLAVRHHLAPDARAATAVEAAADLVGLHATDPASVYLAALARVGDYKAADLEAALYEDRTLLRMLGMRRTVFVVPLDLAAVIQAACTRVIAALERSRLLAMLNDAGIADDPGTWLRDVEAETIAALEARGESTAAELSKAVAGLREQISFGAGRKWQGSVSVSTRLLFVLAAEGRIVRGRPRGSWISTQYRWAPFDRWIPGGLPEWSVEAAQIELARRWLRSFGPGTVADLKWWTGWTVRETKRALDALGAVEVDLDGTAGYVCPDDLEATALPEPWTALLPALDPTVMGWPERRWFLGHHGSALFDRSGNAGPTIWWDGRIVGGWGQRSDGELAYRLLEDVGSDAMAAITSAIARTAEWIGPVRFVNRFRTPLERELTA
jgi:hypothetical protein